MKKLHLINKNELGALPVHNVLLLKGICLGDTLETAATHIFGGCANCDLHAVISGQETRQLYRMFLLFIE
jgi:hypothetical protein